MKLAIISFVLLTFLFTNVLSQNITITDDENYSPDNTALLDIKSTQKGVLVPRLTTAQRTSISSPAPGLMVYDTDDQSFYYSGAKGWTKISSTATENVGVNDALFAVVNPAGDTVFAVYPEGVRVYVEDGIAKGNKGGFAVGGFDASKQTGAEYLRITPDSGGFAVGGFDASKGSSFDLLRISPDSIRMYVDDSGLTKGNKGGFAVGGFDASKGITKEYLRISPDSVRVYIKDEVTKGSKGGFAVGGYDAAKSQISEYMNISGNNTADTIDPSEPRLVWYPKKEAFLSGRVLIESIDSVGTNSMATGFESKAIGNYSQAFGFHARALGNNSTAIGNYAEAQNESSFALGDSAIAKGKGSYAFGAAAIDTLAGNSQPYSTIARGNYSFALGLGNYTDTLGGFALGAGSASMGAFALAMGLYDTSYADHSYTIGYNSIASGIYSTAIGKENRATGKSSYAIGRFCVASGEGSFSMGTNDTDRKSVV